MEMADKLRHRGDMTGRKESRVCECVCGSISISMSGGGGGRGMGVMMWEDEQNRTG